MHEPLILQDDISIEKSHRLIDEAIVQHQAFILALKSQKNDLAPISRLPPEILCRIFSFLKIEVQLDRVDQLPVSLEWVEVTHVCAHWRHVAINMPRLWVDPPLENLRWFEEMLQRSKDSNLEIDADFRDPGLTLALKHSSRIKHLFVRNIFPSSAWNDLQKAFPKDAPELETFCMMGDNADRWFQDLSPDVESNPVVLSEKVFLKTERLRHLVLADCYLNWDSHSSLLRSLTRLTLHKLHSKPTGKQLMDALKGMPNLEFLEITNTFPVTKTWGSDQIHFPCLQTLCVRSIHLDLEAFFRHVTFPPTAVVTIGCIVRDISTPHAEESGFAGVISNLSRSYSNLISDKAFRTLIYRPSSFGVHLFKLFTDVIADEQIVNYGFITPALLELSLRQAGRPSTQYLEKLMANIFSSALPLQDASIHVVLLDTVERRSVEAIANTLRTMPPARSVVLSRHTAAPFLKAMGLGSHHGEAGSIDPAERLHFPDLLSISFELTIFWKSDLAVKQDPTSVSFESLKDYLVHRSQSGAKVERLAFTLCRNLRKDDVDSLSPFVGEIDWDRHAI